MSVDQSVQKTRHELHEQLETTLHAQGATPDLSQIDLNEERKKFAIDSGTLDGGVWLATTVFARGDVLSAMLVKNPVRHRRVLSHAETHSLAMNRCAAVVEDSVWQMVLARRRGSTREYLGMTHLWTDETPEPELEAYSTLSMTLPWLKTVVVIGKGPGEDRHIFHEDKHTILPH